MANPNLTKLPTLPWPVLTGASVLLHVGVLMVGLPQVLPVDNSDGSAVNIPVTLVDGDATPAIAPATPPNLTPQPAVPQPTVPQSSLSQPTSTRGQNSSGNTPEPVAPPSAPSTPQPPDIYSDDASAGSTNSEKANPTPPETVLDQAIPTEESLSQEHKDPQSAEGTNDSGQASPAVIAITAVTIPSGQLNIENEPQQNFQLPAQLTIPGEHSCVGSISVNVPIDVLVEIKGVDGQIAALSDTVSPQIEAATCLLMSAIDMDPSRLGFQPATPKQGIYEPIDQENKISAIGQLTLVFSQ